MLGSGRPAALFAAVLLPRRPLPSSRQDPVPIYSPSPSPSPSPHHWALSDLHRCLKAKPALRSSLRVGVTVWLDSSSWLPGHASLRFFVVIILVARPSNAPLHPRTRVVSTLPHSFLGGVLGTLRINPSLYILPHDGSCGFAVDEVISLVFPCSRRHGQATGQLRCKSRASCVVTPQPIQSHAPCHITSLVPPLVLGHGLVFSSCPKCHSMASLVPVGYYWHAAV